MHDAAFWSVAEPAVAIINCCIATLRPLLKIVSPARLWASDKVESDRDRDRVGYTESKDNSKNRLKRKLGLDGMHDEYPLTRIEDGVTSTTVAAAHGDVGLRGDAESDGSIKDLTALPGMATWESQDQAQRRTKGQGVIRVQTEYKIEGQGR
jgi:hypothetical protein